MFNTPLTRTAPQTLAARARSLLPAQYANYVTASAVVMAGGKAKKGNLLRLEYRASLRIDSKLLFGSPDSYPFVFLPFVPE